MQKFNFILLIDDDNITNFLHQDLISRMQLTQHIETASNAEEALRLIQQWCPGNECPDLILLDLKMPVFDGFDFLEAYNSLPEKKVKKTQVIAVTTSSNPHDVDRLHALGVDKLINKPLTREKIMYFVR